MTTSTQQVQQEQDEPRPTAALPKRLAALDRLVVLGTDRIDAGLIDDTAALLGRAGQRLRLSGDHTVVALAGGTGSGKSSLFNAICGLELSPVGVRRPMTSSAHSCVWGLDGAGPLLDWLDVDKRYRYARASALDRDEGSLQGLVLIDLPDHDSIRAEHVAEVDRYVAVADLLVWVLDPQKYADAAVHRNYLQPLSGHGGVTLLILNQVDRLQPDEVEECVTDLDRILEAGGLHNPHILTTSTVSGAGLDGFREVLTDTVAARRARTERLTADIDKLSQRFEDYRTDAEPPVGISSQRVEELVEALTDAAGAPAVADAMESAYELRAVDYVGWPLAWIGTRLRRDPLRRMRMSELRSELRGTFSSPVIAQQAYVDNALQGITDDATADLPEAWRRSVREASRQHAEDLPEALGKSVVDVVPMFNQVPRWWWLVRIWQYFLLLVGAVGLVWLGALVTFGVLQVGHAPFALAGDPSLLPYVGLLFACTLGLGALTASACHNLIALSSTRHSERMEERMRDHIARVAQELVLEPIEQELGVYARFRSEVSVAIAES